MTFPTSAPYEARNTDARPVLIDVEPIRRSQREKRREAIQAHRDGKRKPVALSPTLSTVVV